MKRISALSIRTFISFTILLIINIVLITYIFHEMYIQTLPFAHINFIIIIGLIDIGIVVTYYISVIAPYLRIKNLYKMFLNGQNYEELFQEKNYLTPELLLVMERFHYLLNKQDAINMSNKQAEYLALQNQINPHFLYNTLEAIRGDALYAGIPNIAETIEALASFFRYTITDVGNLVTLEDELENVENYFTIQQYRFDNKYKMIINYPDNEENIQLLQLPKLTLQPIIENAIFHGLEGKYEGGNIHINIETTKENLFINVIDNGLGILPETLSKINDSLDRVAISYINSDKKGGGIALKNVCRRIKLLFGDEYGVHIFSSVDIGTDVRLVLPKIQKT